MRTVRLLMLVALTLVTAPPAVQAFDAPGCGCGPSTYSACDEWRSAVPTSMTCVFKFEGFPITVYGDNASGGSVHVSVTLRGSPEVVLLECEDRPQCGDEIHDEGLTDPLPPLPAVVPRVEFQCSIESTGSGTYYCSSGRA